MKKVLVVEDDPVWSSLLSQYCRQLGLKPICARSPQEAMDRIDVGEKFSCIILDMLLAAETGMALLNELRAYPDLREIPVLVCSSILMEIDDLSPFGVNEILNKSTMKPDDLRQMLARVTQ